MPTGCTPEHHQNTLVLTAGPHCCSVPLPAARPQPRPSGGIAPKNTTVYVGKIAPTLEDAVVQQLLQACGATKSWKRMTVSRGSFLTSYLRSRGCALCISKLPS
jgi:hypothetical protein